MFHRHYITFTVAFKKESATFYDAGKKDFIIRMDVLKNAELYIRIPLPHCSMYMHLMDGMPEYVQEKFRLTDCKCCQGNCPLTMHYTFQGKVYRQCHFITFNLQTIEDVNYIFTLVQAEHNIQKTSGGVNGMNEYNRRAEERESFQVIGVAEYGPECGWNALQAWWVEGVPEKIENKYANSTNGEHFYIDFPAPTAEEPNRLGRVIGCKYNGIENTDNYTIITIPAGKYLTYDLPEEFRDDSWDYYEEYHLPKGYTDGGWTVEHHYGNKEGDKIEGGRLIKRI
jgi:hypothetical protein